MRRVRAALALLAALALPMQALSQTPSRPAARPAQPEPQSAPEAPPPPYEPQLLRLSEILGALAWLQEVCSDRDAAQWRASMRALIEAEAQTQARRERLAGAYNRGFRSYETLHRTCTPNAQTIIDRFLDEGRRLANDVAGRFGSG